MAMDEKHDDGLGGRSRDRREVNAGNRWARALCRLVPREFEAAPLPEEVRDAAALLRSLDSPRAIARQIQRVDKLIRLLEDDEIAAIDAFLAKPTVAPRPVDPQAVALDGWCDRLIAEGDAALDAWVALHPDADRQRLRTLARNAKGGAPDRRRALRDALAR